MKNPWAASLVHREPCTVGRSRRYAPVYRGWVAEWFKALVLKTSDGASRPWVRIPPHPPGRDFLKYVRPEADTRKPRFCGGLSVALGCCSHTFGERAWFTIKRRESTVIVQPNGQTKAGDD